MATTNSNIQDTNFPIAGPVDLNLEREQAKKLAERYRCGFIDLLEQRIDPELFRTIQADLMFRYNFVPLVSQNNTLVIAVADPSQVLLSDELPLLLGKKLAIKVATPRQISDLLKRTEQSQRVLEQATEAFTLQVSKDEEEGEETISGDRLTRDTTVSPVVRLVETVIFTALERRASDIHIEARDGEVAVKYRIDGVLQHAMQPIAKEWHSSVISRIKVLSDWILPSVACRRTAASGLSTRDAISTCASRSCRPATERMPCFACWTKKHFRRNFKASAWMLSGFHRKRPGGFAAIFASLTAWCW